MDAAQRAYTAQAWDYYAKRLEAETPESLAEKEAYSVLGPVSGGLYLKNKEIIATKQAAIEKESSKGTLGKAASYLGRAFTGQTPDSEKFIAETQAEIDRLAKENLVYEEQLKMYRETGFGSLDDGVPVDVSSNMAKELIDSATREIIVQTMFGGPLQSGFSYKTYQEANQAGILYIQLLDSQGKEYGKPVEVPAHLAATFNETIPYAMQGN